MIIVTVTSKIHNRLWYSQKHMVYSYFVFNCLTTEKLPGHAFFHRGFGIYYWWHSENRIYIIYHIVFAPSYWVWTMNIYSKVVRVLLVPYKAFSCGVLHRFYNMGRFLDRNSGCFKILTAQCISAKQIFSMLISKSQEQVLEWMSEIQF